ncbi:probable G protein-coupled receptor 85 [Amphiura filiformis]|uniref:probable G protein-coupled receptor 85 n=1 Tax=Amphiura filiformis TaxID=82378 RepID=UPI003B20F004
MSISPDASAGHDQSALLNISATSSSTLTTSAAVAAAKAHHIHKELTPQWLTNAHQNLVEHGSTGPTITDEDARVLWSGSIIVIIILSAFGNGILSFVVFSDSRLRRPSYFFMFNCALSDFVKSLLCFPFVVSAVVNNQWIHTDSLCEILAFFNVYLTFGVLYTLFLISIERYVVLRFHRFHRQKLKGPACLLCVLAMWALAVSMAFPPVFNLGTYAYSKLEHQCTFHHEPYERNDTLCFLLFFIAVIAFTHFSYLRVFLFMRAHRKMRPMQFVPAVSNNWTFYGPGSTGQAAANWFMGFRQGPTPPPLIGLAPPNRGRGSSLSRSDFMREESFAKLSFCITVAFTFLWFPYIIYCFWLVFSPADKPLPPAFVSMATWLTYFQACVNPLICFIMSKEVRHITLQTIFGQASLQQEHNVQL